MTYAATSNGYSVLVHSDGTSDTYIFYDILGRPIQSNIQGFGGAWIYRSTRYDALGRVVFKSLPAFNTPSAIGVSYGYDVLGRVTSETDPGLATPTTMSYSGLTTTVTNPLGQPTTTVKNSQGKVVQVSDNAGTTSYVYDPFLNLAQVTDAAGNVTTTTHDGRGRKIAMRDPDMGNWSYGYDVLNELTSQTDAKGQQITMGYDKLGRMTARTAPEGSSTWTYDTSPHGIGKLAAVAGPNNYQESYTYDTLSRPSEATYGIAGTNYTVGRGYDGFGRLDTIVYPMSGYTVKQTYDAYGHLWQVYRQAPDGTQTLLWQTDSADALAHITHETFGNGVASARGYDPQTLDLLSIQTGSGASTTNIQNLSYGYDGLHNLTSRSDAVTGLTEAFTYDNVNRLIQATGTVTKTYAYDSIGNITNKSDVGAYTYPTSGPTAVRPHAVTSVAGVVNASYTYDPNGNMLAGNGRTIAYTSFNKPQTVSGPNGSITLAYGANYNRIQKTTQTDNTVYVGKLFERRTAGSLIEEKNYVYAGNSLVAIFTHRNNGIDDTKYVHADHVGSVSVITDENGNVIERLSYDPFGRRRQTNGQDATSAITSSVNRGFARHEHDDEVGLINMNARLYDPLLGRFIGADSAIEGAAGQGLNRYSYVRNNPLTLTDPTGNWSLRKHLRALARFVVSPSIKSGFDVVHTLPGAPKVEKALLRNRTLHSVAEIAAAYFGGPEGAAAFSGYMTMAAGGSASDALRAGAAGYISGIAIGVAGQYGALGQMVGGGVNGYLQTGDSEGFWRGFAAGTIPQNLGIDAYSTNPWANIGIGIARDGLRGYVVGGRDGIVSGIEYGQLNNAVGHLVGFVSTGAGPDFRNGVFYYRGSAWYGNGAITFGNVISAGNAGRWDPFNNNNLLLHEGGHVSQATALGAAYIPTQVLMAGYSLIVNSSALVSGIYSGDHPGLGYYTHLSNPLESKPFVPVNWNDVY